ncbi:MAG: dihydropteroate synthase, partial [Muribaculaceae bacterium]|nr:dihydropteroate synthase [Muribaculaceae bacterium]
TVAALRVPYILMHMRGTPETMQSMTDYPQGVTSGVIAELAPKLEKLALLGVNDVIVDPGFGFAKTLEQNYRLLHDLEAFAMLGRPVLVGVSRKSMVTRLLGIKPEDALNATTVLNTIAIERGASILRVHDVRAARETVDIISCLHNA